MLSTKPTIIRNFDRHAHTYENAADMQRYVAGQLAASLGSSSPKTILEIGCGTGILSNHLIHLFPDASLLLTDFSPAMLAQCKKNVSAHQDLCFSYMDGEQLIVSNTYDLIVSSMTAHWFTDFQRSFIDITRQLNQGGEFVFSMLGENSFKEWRAICYMANIPCGIPLFPAAHLLKTILPSTEIHVTTYQKNYITIYDFLNSLKILGAATPRSDYKPISLMQLRSVLRRFNTEINISYEVIYGVYKNKNI